jgi:hypothetical protein
MGRSKFCSYCISPMSFSIIFFSIFFLFSFQTDNVSGDRHWLHKKINQCISLISFLDCFNQCISFHKSTFYLHPLSLLYNHLKSLVSIFMEWKKRYIHGTTLCDKVCHWLATCRWFSRGTLVSSTNKTDHTDIT